MDFVKSDDVKQQIHEVLAGIKDRKSSAPQWERDHEWFYVQKRPTDVLLYQGDILRLPQLRFLFDLEDSIDSVECEYGLLVSNTCDMQIDDKPDGVAPRESFVSVIPLQRLLSPAEENKLRALQNQPPLSSRDKDVAESFHRDVRTFASTSTFYLPPTPPIKSTGRDGAPHTSVDGLYAHYGEFGQIQPMSSRLLNESLRRDPTIRLLSLSQKAFYILLMKLSAYYLRHDDRW